MARLAPLSILLLALAAGCHREAPPEPQAQPEAATPEAPSTAGVVAIDQKGKGMPDVEIQDPADAKVKLASFKGKPVLVNLWATWCVPCVKEMPTLDALAAREAGKLTVLSVSEDMEGRKVVAPFFRKHGYKALRPYTDKSNALLLKLKEAGLPISVLYGADGKELWRVRGDMEWTGDKAKALLAEAGI